MASNTRRVQIPQNFETTAWKWMRYSAIALIPLVFLHVILQDVIVGVHRIDASYVAMRWGTWFIQVYDIALLGFAFAHGVNGLRQILRDFIHNPQVFRIVSIVLLVFWAGITAYGGAAIVMAMNSKLVAGM
ncbi:MAG: hypothetical protein OHK0052_06030 [Anaerolineales bacterium]